MRFSFAVFRFSLDSVLARLGHKYSSGTLPFGFKSKATFIIEKYVAFDIFGCCV
jgi:hypothetical protein